MKEYKQRVIIVAVGLALLVALYLVVLFSIQIKGGEAHANQVERIHVGALPDTYDRGSIYFTRNDGTRFAAATLRKGYIAAINPSTLEDPKGLYGVVSEYIPDMDYSWFMRRATKPDDPYEEIARELDFDTVKHIRLKTDDVIFSEHRWRYYPTGEVAAQTIGFLGFVGDERKGRYGLEQQYEQDLKLGTGESDVNIFAELFAGIRSALNPDAEKVDVVTTIDPEVQIYIHERLRQMQKEWSGAMVGGIIIRPDTGEVVGMETLPTFNLNDYGNPETISYHTNPLVEHVFEMGSIFKPVVMAIGIETGSVNPETVYYDEGSVEVGDVVVHNYDKKGRGYVTMQDVLGESLNTGMVFIADKVDRRVMYDYIRSFGIGEPSGIGLPNEHKGLVSNLESRRQVEYANISFGQGIAITPMAMIKALTPLANDGQLTTPTLTKPETPLVQPTVLQPETAETVTRMMVDNVDTYLRGGDERLEYYSVAAKTGTAQIPSPDGGYYQDRNLHAFVGYVPAYQPEYLIMYFIQHPKGAKFSSETLTTPFMDTVKFLINYYSIEPDRSPS